MDFISNKQLINVLKNLVKIPTENPPGITKEIVDYFITHIFKEEEGFQNKIVTHEKNKIILHNLITKIGTGKKKIVLTGHFDVVSAGNFSDWLYPPFSAEIRDNKLYGRGSVDMKGGLTMLIGVMKNLNRYPEFLKQYCIVFAGTADEELGMTGALTLYNEGIMNDAKLLVIAEPTNMNIGVAEKGLLWIKFNIYGKAAHGSMPEKGINSILAASNLIPNLYNLLDKEESKILGISTLNIGRIDGGTLINVVPEKTELELDFRLIPEQNCDKLIKRLKNLNIDPCKFSFKILKKLPALQSEVNNPFIQNLRNICCGELIGLPYATDGAHLINPNNLIPFVIFGPGDPTVAHAVNEYIDLNSVFKSTEFLTKAILQTFS